jgi:hypothetical protein
LAHCFRHEQAKQNVIEASKSHFFYLCVFDLEAVGAHSPLRPLSHTAHTAAVFLAALLHLLHTPRSGYLPLSLTPHATVSKNKKKRKCVAAFTLELDTARTLLLDKEFVEVDTSVFLRKSVLN